MSQTKVKSGLLNFPDQTDFVKLPSGTTAQRPSSPEKGYSRYNTTDNKLEYWNGTEWQQLPALVPPIITSISYPGDDLAADPAGGQTITINGTDFITGATVTVDGTTPSVITFVSATEITFTAPAKTAGDYDIVVTNVDGGNATAVDGMTYNGLPSWTTPAGNLGTFAAGSTIPTITLVATEPDSGVVSYSVTTGALPTGLALTGADIDGTVPSPAGQTTYNFSITASDDENQSTERAFNIVVYLQVTNTVSKVDPFGDSSGVALYRFENNANDEGDVYNGTPSNVTWGSSGVFNESASFNNTNSYIALQNNSLNFLNEYSLSIWIKSNGDFNGDTIFANYSYSASNTTENGFMLRKMSGNVLRVDNWINNANQNFISSVIPVNVWTHISVVNTQSNIKLYINGILDISSLTNGFNYHASNITFPVIGGYLYENGTIGNSFSGLIDQVRIFNKAILPLEVESLYKERTVICGGQADTLDILGDNSCIATYQLNGNANDLSGNYSGTPTDVSYGVGEFDLAGVFNGSSSYVQTNYSPSYAAISHSLWFKANAADSANAILYFDNRGGRVDVTINSTSSNSIVNDGFELTRVNCTTATSQWNHLVLVYDNWAASYSQGVYSPTTINVTGYLNGNLLGTITNKPYGQTTGMRLGRSGGSYYYEGSIDQIRIFNKALNSTEVTTLYNETACDALACSGTTNTLDILSDGSCIATYPLDGSPADLSGNYNGVQTNVTYPVGKFDLGAMLNKDLSASAPSNFVKSGFAVDSSIFDGRTAMTESMWVYRENEADPIMINGIWYNGGQRQLAINIIGTDSGTYYGDGQPVSANTIRVWFAGNTNTDIVKSFSYTAPVNEWFHFAVVFNGSSTSLAFYVNASLVGTLTDSAWTVIPDVSGNTPPTNQVSFGCSPYTDISGSGRLDQVRVFNKALSAGEVTTLYNETACN